MNKLGRVVAGSTGTCAHLPPVFQTPCALFVGWIGQLLCVIVSGVMSSLVYVFTLHPKRM
jgi:hypothetical protein